MFIQSLTTLTLQSDSDRNIDHHRAIRIIIAIRRAVVG